MRTQVSELIYHREPADLKLRYDFQDAEKPVRKKICVV